MNNEPTDDTTGDEQEATAEMIVDSAALDLDGDGTPDAVVVQSATAIDLDGDGTPDAVHLVEAIGVDSNQDGEISDDEIEVTETILVREDLVTDDDPESEA